jgi:hypothetical protein
MNPRLVVIEGSLRGTVMPLAAGEPFPIGRSPSNRLAPTDRSVSHQHCLIQQKEGRWTICDLDSHSGTFVNDLPVRERILQQGDRIRVGDSVLLFLMSEQESTVDYGLTLMDDDFLPMKGKAAHVEQHEAIEVSPSEDRTIRELSVLSKIGIVLSSVRDLGTLEQRVLELILEAVPADRGVIFLADANEREFSSVCKLARDPGQSWSLSISRRLIDRILQGGAAFLCNDISEGQARSRSLLAVPVILFEKVLGVIYVDTTDRDTHFDAGHVKTLTAVAGSAAVALNDALRMERLEAENLRLGAEINLGRNMVG